MYENGQVVDSMRVVAGRPDPIAQTPMMNAFIRYVALNPYWNSPPDITARASRRTWSGAAAPTSTKKGYELVDQFGDGAHVLESDVGRLAGGRRRPGPRATSGRSRGRPTRWAG